MKLEPNLNLGQALHELEKIDVIAQAICHYRKQERFELNCDLWVYVPCPSEAEITLDALKKEMFLSDEMLKTAIYELSKQATLVLNILKHSGAYLAAEDVRLIVYGLTDQSLGRTRMLHILRFLLKKNCIERTDFFGKFRYAFLSDIYETKPTINKPTGENNGRRV